MQPEARARLEHAVAAREAILRFARTATFETYAADEVLRSAVERQFTIVGEALRAAEKIDPSLTSRISGLRRIVDFRNVLVHGYAVVFDEAVWLILQEHLPKLLTEVRALLSGSPPR